MYFKSDSYEKLSGFRYRIKFKNKIMTAGLKTPKINVQWYVTQKVKYWTNVEIINVKIFYSVFTQSRNFMMTGMSWWEISDGFSDLAGTHEQPMWSPRRRRCWLRICTRRNPREWRPRFPSRNRLFDRSPCKQKRE